MQTDLTYNNQFTTTQITSHTPVAFLKQFITHPIHKFSDFTLLMAHNSLPCIQQQQPTDSDQRQFLQDVEQYMNNMFADTRQRIQEFCDTKGYMVKNITCFICTH